jgi:hypothetical protein
MEAFHRSFEGGLHVDAGFRKEPVERLPEDLHVRPPDELPERPVAPPDPAARIGQEEHVVDAVDRPLPLLLGRRDQAVDAGEFVVLLPEFRELPGDALRGPRHADGDFVPVEEPLDVPKVPLFLLAREPGGPDRSRYAWRKNLTSPRKIPRGIPSRRRLRASTTPNAESPSSRPTSSAVSEGGEGSERNAWSREPDSPRSVARHASGVPGRNRKYPFASARERTCPSRRSSFRTMRSVNSVTP